MSASIVVRFPQGPPAVVAELVGKAACLGAKYELGLLDPSPPPAHVANACDVAGCLFVGEMEEGGQTWLVYLCSGVIEAYPA